MKAFVLTVAALACSLGFCSETSAHGGIAVTRIRQPLFRPRVQVVRQQLVAPAIVSPFVFRQQVVVPQQLVVPQSFSFQQQLVVPNYSAFSTQQLVVPQCSSSMFFAY